jgi:hypothetical protein
MNGSNYTYEDKEDFQGKMVRVLTSTYQPGKPDASGDWRGKLSSADEALGYLKTALRYWYSDECYGSEKSVYGG